jgi:ABC-type glycerol-3-phosphate transport system substrate-binding protein
MKKILIGIIFSLLALYLVRVNTIENVSADTQTETTEYSIISNLYSSQLKKWKNEGLRDDLDFYQVVSPFGFYLDSLDDELIYESETNQYHDFLVANDLNIIDSSGVLNMNSSDEVNYFYFDVLVENEGLYQVLIDYYSTTDGIRNIEIDIMVNNEYQYFESSQIILDSYYETSKDFKLDRYENEIMPRAFRLDKWNHLALMDSSRLQENPLLFKFNEGENKLRIGLKTGSILIGQIYVQNQEKIQTYAEYLNSNQSSVNDDFIIERQAESIDLKNSLSIRYGTNREPSVKPFELVANKLNILDGSTFYRPGNQIFYDIEVEDSGFYYITFKVLQNRNNTRVYRKIYVNGEIPFLEAKQIAFDYNSNWVNQTISNTENEPYLFYLNSGINQIGLEVNTSPFLEIYENIKYVMDRINDLTLDIKKLTGNNLDKNREWDIVTFMPNIKQDLLNYAEIIKYSHDQYVLLSGNQGPTEVSSHLKLSYQWLEELAVEPNDIPKNLAKLSTGSNSVMQKLGISLPLVIQSPLSIDVFYVHGDNQTLPRATTPFFRKLFVSIQRFFASFFANQYRFEPNDDELEIWVNRSRQFVNLMQQMTDDEFTEDTGIKVRISLMPNEDKLILAASSNKEPDLALGVAGWRPYDFAIRNAVYDLSQFSDFRSVSTRFKDGAFMQLIYQEGVYGLPETQNFYLLFYRKDIIEKLNLEIPNTWDDVIDILPELQRYGLNFYSILSGSSAFKGFTSTMPFIQQYGGKIFSDDALSSSFDDPKTIEAITLMTDLYTIYSLPTEVGSFYNNFRYGNLPIGIGDFGMYVQLLHAAPEIAGLWDIAPIPGIMDTNGIVNRSYDGASTSAMMFKNSQKKEEAWEFLKWWTSKDVQVNYAENLISSMGPEYMWNTSNVEAFREMNWDRNHQEIFLEQWNFLIDTAKTPASYMLERELSNIWNKVVFSGENIRTAIEDSSIVVDKEITRKMIEFGFINQRGEQLKSYRLPNRNNINEWVGESN